MVATHRRRPDHYSTGVGARNFSNCCRLCQSWFACHKIYPNLPDKHFKHLGASRPWKPRARLFTNIFRESAWQGAGQALQSKLRALGCKRHTIPTMWAGRLLGIRMGQVLGCVMPLSRFLLIFWKMTFIIIDVNALHCTTSSLSIWKTFLKCLRLGLQRTVQRDNAAFGQAPC